MSDQYSAHVCSDLVSQLVESSPLDVFPILGTSDFTTFESMCDRAQEYLSFSGGRVTSHELQSFLNVDKLYVDRIIQKLVQDHGAGDTHSRLLFVGGELIASEYLLSIVGAIEDLIQRHRRQRYTSDGDNTGDNKAPLRIGRLATHFGLPLDVLTSLVKTHFPHESSLVGTVSVTSSSSRSEKKGSAAKKKKRGTGGAAGGGGEKEAPAATTASSSADSAGTENTCSDQNGTLVSAVYGYCLGAMLPLPLSAIFAAAATGSDDEAALLKVMHMLTEPSAVERDSVSRLRLPGSCNSKEYVPLVFANQQRLRVDDHFRTNNFITFAHLQSLHVQSKALEYLSVSFEGVVMLDSCVASRVLLELLKSSIDEVTIAFPFASEVTSSEDLKSEGGVPAPWVNLASMLPSALTDADVTALLKACGSNVHSKASAVCLASTGCGDSFLVNNQLVGALKDILSTDATSTATAEAMAIACVQQTKNSHQSASSSTHATISTTVTKKPLAAPSSKNKADALDEDEGMGRGKKGKGKKTGVKAGRQSSATIDEELDGEAPSKASRKSGKRAKDNSSRASSDHATSSAAADSPDDSVSLLVAPFLCKRRLMALLLQFCAKASVEVQEALDALEHNYSGDFDSTFFVDNNSTVAILSFFESLYELVLPVASKEYRSAAERALLCAARGTHDSRMKRELNRDQKFEELWLSLQVSSKILLSFEKAIMPESTLFDQFYHMHSVILIKKCLPIVTMLTEFCCWENNVDCPQVTEGKVALTYEQRCQLQADLPQGSGNLLVKLWKSVGVLDTGAWDPAATVWKFMDLLSSSVFKDSFNLIVHKVDKKKEKALSFAFKQALLDAVRAETSLDKLPPLVLSLAAYQVSNSVLELPGDIMTHEAATGPGSGLSHPVVAFLLAWLAPPRLALEDYNAIYLLLQTAIDPSTTAVDHTTVAEAAKQAVLKKPSTTHTA